MSFIAIIPSRYGSSRLPGKPLLDIAGQPLIAHVVARAKESNAERVIVATDDERIRDVVKSLGCDVCMTRSDHESGSDRLAEVVSKLAIDEKKIIVNVQGDEPLIPPKLINQVAQLLAQAPHAVMSTAAQLINTQEDFDNPNVVKVVIDQTGRALYFSRAGIPYSRDDFSAKVWHHIGIYAYRTDFLKQYAALMPSEIEKSECLEQLRVLDNGQNIMVQKIDYDAGMGIDTPADLEKVRALLS